MRKTLPLRPHIIDLGMNDGACAPSPNAQNGSGCTDVHSLTLT